MKTNLLITTTAVALLTSTSFVMAQKGAESGSRSSPAPTMSAPGASGSSESRGPTEGSATPDKKGASAQGSGAVREKSAQSSSGSEHMTQKGSESGGKMDSSKTESNKMGSANKTDSSNKAETNSKTQAQGSSGSSTDRAESKSGNSTSEKSTGDRNASTASSQTNVQLSREQRTKIHETVIKQSNAPRLSRNDVKFSVTVGTVIPRSVHVATLPSAVIEIHPQWRGYEYVLVGDEIVILEPSSLRIVAIIAA
jgi:hypothetical protein